MVGMSIALVLQTNIRITSSFGVGEIGLGLFVLYAVFMYFGKLDQDRLHDRHKPILFLFCYLILVLFPLTILHSVFGTVGSSISDCLAYALGVAVALSVVVTDVNRGTVTRAIIIFTLLFVSYQYLFGGEDSWYYSVRFTGGANNPNQLALYIVCCILLLTIVDFRPRTKMALLAAIVFFGFCSLSDAFLASLMSVAGMVLLLKIVPKKYLVYIVVPFIFIFIITMFMIVEGLNEKVLGVWVAADEGDTRTVLYANGLNAWLSSFFSVFIGNGAGAFSGNGGPFESSESHNLIIDILSIGGLLGFYAFYYLFAHNMWVAYRIRENYVFSGLIGLFVFSLFHFTARQPLYWFTLFAVSEHLWQLRYRSKE